MHVLVEPEVVMQTLWISSAHRCRWRRRSERRGVQSLEPRIELLRGRASRDEHGREQREHPSSEGGPHEPPPPTVSTELGAP